jgi:hypothetical protein
MVCTGVRTVIVVILLSLAFGSPCTGQVSGVRGPSLIGIDHMPTVVANPKEAVGSFQRLGFAIKPGRFHVNGLRNSHIKFKDGSGIELISPPRQPSDHLTKTYAGFLRNGEGPAYIAFHARDTEALTSALRKSGILFECDGGILSLVDPNLDFIFFLQDNRSPTDRPEHFAHPNTAFAVTEVWLALDPPGRASLRRLLLALGAVESTDTVPVPNKVLARVFTVRNGRVVVLPDTHHWRKGRRIIGVKFRVHNLQAAGRFLNGADATVAPSGAHDVWPRFER